MKRVVQTNVRKVCITFLLFFFLYEQKWCAKCEATTTMRCAASMTLDSIYMYASRRHELLPKICLVDTKTNVKIFYKYYLAIKVVECGLIKKKSFGSSFISVHSI